MQVDVGALLVAMGCAVAFGGTYFGLFGKGRMGAIIISLSTIAGILIVSFLTSLIYWGFVKWFVFPVGPALIITTTWELRVWLKKRRELKGVKLVK